jgi:sugar lactone lactonase YvrE
MAELIAVVPVSNQLGEGVLWNPADGCFWWTDILCKRLYRHELASGRTGWVETPHRLCAFAFLERTGRILAAFDTGLAYFEPDTGAVEWLHRPAELGHGMRLNDGRVDRQGRFWVGSMCEDTHVAPFGSASLYRLDSDLSLTAVLSGVGISNGICWSVDGTRFHFADSPRQTITVFDCDPASGALGPARPFAETTGDAFPDGAIIDSQDHMWSAQWGGGRVVRYDPSGAIRDEIVVPVSQATCAAFGGEQLDLLCITSASDGLSTDVLDGQPQAGHAFIYRVDVPGTHEYGFLGPGTEM